jgi:energy-coupling factor transporter ATP-binding protein EcfA2
MTNNREDGVDISVTTARSPERPINTPDQDKLERRGFIARLCHAVIDRNTKKATGAIIGITGPWGSGKSSILNLLDQYIKADYPDAIVVRFDPWLISGRNDLISEFITELIAELRQAPNGKQRFKKTITKLVGYGNTLTPLADLLPYGGAVKDALKIAKDHFDRDKSVHEQRHDLIDTLSEISAPIIVLIDELDRVEDEEIRIVAQLVRAIADFPGMSYILAYDVERVIRALAGSEKLEKGRAYLEKIVQLQVPLPVLIDDEIHRLIEADLDDLCAAGLIPSNRLSIERYVGLRGLLVPRLIATPRDAKRLTATFRTLLYMLSGEVDWIDLMGYCALLVKAPLTVEQIKRDPDAVVDDPTSVGEMIARASEPKTGIEAVLVRVNPEHEGGEGVQSLLAFLFPRLSDDRVGRRYGHRDPTSICKMRPLLTMLRLDLVPGFYSREEIVKTFSRSPDDLAAFLRESYQQNRIGNFLAKLGDMSADLRGMDQQSFWPGVGRFLRKPDSEFLSAYSSMHEIVRLFAVTFFQITGKAARALFLDLLTENEVELTGSLMRSHLFHYGLFGHTRSDRDVFLEGNETETIARDVSAKYRQQHLEGRFFWSLWQFNPVYTMLDTGAWDDTCRTRLKEFLIDPKALDALTLLFYGEGFTTGRETISKIVDLHEYLQSVEERLGATDLHASVRVALEKAKDLPT